MDHSERPAQDTITGDKRRRIRIGDVPLPLIMLAIIIAMRTTIRTMPAAFAPHAHPVRPAPTTMHINCRSGVIMAVCVLATCQMMRWHAHDNANNRPPKSKKIIRIVSFRKLEAKKIIDKIHCKRCFMRV